MPIVCEKVPHSKAPLHTRNDLDLATVVFQSKERFFHKMVLFGLENGEVKASIVLWGGL